MSGSKTWWMVRCEGGSLFEDFVEGGFVALGSEPAEPDLSRATDRDSLYEILERSGLWNNIHRLGYAWGVLSRFALEMKEGDRVVTYNPSTRTYRVGGVAGPYEFDTDRLAGKQHFRRVAWEAEVERDLLPKAAKRSLASMMSVFELREEVAEALEAAAAGRSPPAEASVVAEVAEPSADFDVTARARELVKDKIARLDWSEMEELVAGVLRAMGYKTRMTERGSDRGRDILASPDGLGLEQPRIVAEVKHRREAIGALDMRGFIGGLSPTDRGLYVSKGGFTRDARYEADRSNVPVTMLDIDSFVQLLLEHYHSAGSRVRSLVPLVAVWWPIEEVE